MGSDIQSLAVHAIGCGFRVIRGAGFASFAITAGRFWPTLSFFVSNSRTSPWNVNFDLRILGDGSGASSRVTVIKCWFMRWAE
ncbi:MAG: hypothetical protein HOF74_02675 [Gammaproteobacteria bacterium]|nr:hypothetical protein [Gammaproteobacteria bacterium]MBT3858710.1 hypothetical protein [Gammaproteobacteria bacterium]MBT3986062.1 hypothetical protein [Gammaproteobacteria bacterium]MBT4257174.1 hypothetical protein [Gammaproteobacteria bacterium]MBT4580773.1 hypothetical protein [Gammaproteobacteria bacterium]